MTPSQSTYDVVVVGAGIVGVATLLSFIAYSWVSVAESRGKDLSSSMQASDYVYLHQTRNGASPLQKVSDRSPLQCTAE